MTLRTTLITILAVVGLLLNGLLPALAQESSEDELIELVANTEEFTGWLETYPGWQGAAYYNGDDGTWYVEFYDAAGEEWLGNATVVDATQEVVETFAPRPLPPDEFQAGQERVHTLILEDPEVQALLVDPILWDIYVDYNRWDRVWEAWISRGLDAMVVRVSLTDDYFSIDEIADGHALEEEAALQAARDEAIALAYGAPDVWTALEGYDDWHTYSEQHGDSVWSVAFVSDDAELFYALVNVDSDEVLATSAD